MALIFGRSVFCVPPWLLLYVSVAVVGCGRNTARPSPDFARNLLFITIDTLRADRVGAYGATNVETPNIDRLAREGARARHSTVHVPLTRPSHISIFTGLYPAEHGIRDNVSPPLRQDVPLLAETLKASGFSTAAFIGSIVLSRQSGLDRGFDHYSDTFEIGEDDARFLNTIQRPGDVVTGEAVDWIKTHAKERFFAWLHLYDPHDPYEPPGGYATTYADRPYDGEVAWSDELVGRLLGALEDAGAATQTLVIVTSDHGEGLGEHGEEVHGYFVYETTLSVPLVLRGPGVRPGTVVDVLARSIDLFPTVVDLLGVARQAPTTSGRSLAGALRGEQLVDEPSFAESLVPLVHFGWSDLRSVRDGRWKYVLAPRAELYDLDRDLGELTNLAEREPARARAMRMGLEQRLRAERTTARTAPAAAAVPPDLLEKLGALGYVSPGGPSDAKAAGADPKDKLEEYKVLNTLMRQGLIALREGRPADSARHLQALARHGVESFEAHYYLGRAYTALRRWREAAVEYEKAVEKLPAYGPAWRALGESRVAMKDLAAAARAYEKLASLAPNDALARVRLGEIYRDLGRAADAERLLREAVALDARPASYWNALGMVLGGSGKLADAERAFDEAMKRDSRDPQYAYNRGLSLQRLGRRAEAAELFRKAAERGFAPAKARLAELGVDGAPR
jgi:arylsulfatase A-like enzyme/Flp pilus assembly protein TadD